MTADVEAAAIELWDALRALGFDPAEIQWHVDRPGESMRTGYA